MTDYLDWKLIYEVAGINKKIDEIKNTLNELKKSLEKKSQ